MRPDGRIGRTMGRYRIDSKIGQGGFATVYRAHDTVLERSVALKVLDQFALRDPTSGRRFLREGKAVAQLDHPAIVPVYDAGEHDDGTPWMAMRLVEGGSLGDALANRAGFTHDEVLALVIRIASALDHAHEHGLIHRDVKPSNILLAGSEPAAAWLTDFGIAVNARSMGLYTTGALGTAAYMAPEQARPNQAGPPADFYSLACVTYELLTGERPFPGKDYVALLLAHARDPVPPTGDGRLDAFMAKALAKQPGDRPTSGAAMVEELRFILTGADGVPVRIALAAGSETTPTVPRLPTPNPSPTPDEPEGPATPDETPTVVEGREPTLVHPHSMLPAPIEPPAPAAPAPQHVQMAPQSHPEYPGSDPTLARRARRRARRSLWLGLLLLAVAGAVMVAVMAAVFIWEPERRIDDRAGAAYTLPTGWDHDVNQALGRTTITNGNDVTMFILVNRPANDATVGDVLNASPDCAGQVVTIAADAERGLAEAVCNNPNGHEIAQIQAFLAHNQMWTITVTAEAADEWDNFRDSLEFGPPGSDG